MITLTIFFKAIEIGGGSVILHIYPIFFIAVLTTIPIAKIILKRIMLIK